MFQAIPVEDKSLFAFKASGKLSDQDYQHFLPELEEIIASSGPISLLMELEDFHGWDAKAAWDDFEFGAKHKDDFLRIAIVGETRWQHWMTSIGNAFSAYEIQYFSKDQINTAWDWLREKPQPSVQQDLDSSLIDLKKVDLKPYQHILVAVDFSPNAEIALKRAVDLANFYNARVSLIHTVESISYANASFDFTLVQTYDYLETDQIIFDTAKAKLEKIVQQLGKNNIQSEVLWGSPKSTILSYAEAQNIDLIVVGSHGRHGLARLLGSTASSLVQSARCDVVVVKIAE